MVYKINCGITGHKGVLGSEFIKSASFKFIKFKGDITNKKEITNWILKNNFDVFLHLAAIVPTEKVNRNYTLAKKVNYDGTKNIVDALLKKKNIWFFFASSSHVYSNSSKKYNKKIIIKNFLPRSKLIADIKKITKLGWNPIDNINDILGDYEKKKNIIKII